MISHRRQASPLHAARASAGALFCCALGAAALLHEHPVVLAACAVAVLGAGVGAGVLGPMRAAARLAVPLAVLVALINPLVVREGLTVFARLGEIPPLGQVDLTVEALVYGALLGLRVVIVVLAFALFSAAVDPDEMLRLFRRVSFRSALTAALATRLVPVLARDARRVAEAQRCRAREPRSRAIGRVAVVRAVAAGSLDRAVDVAATLEVRGYGGRRRTPSRGREPWSRHDVAFVAAALGIVALAAAATFGGVANFEAYPRIDAGLGLAELALALALVVVALLPFADRRGIER